MSYRVHNLASDGLDVYFETAAEAAAAVAAAEKGAKAPKRPAAKPHAEEEETP